MKIPETVRNLLLDIDARDVLVIGGLAAVTIGAGQIYAPLAWIVPGSACVALGLKMGNP